MDSAGVLFTTAGAAGRDSPSREHDEFYKL